MPSDASCLRRLRNWLEYFVFRFAICLLQILSPRQSKAIAESLARVICTRLPHKLTRYDIARANIRIAFGDRYSDTEIDRIIFQMWVHLFRMLSEIAQLPRKLRVTNAYDVMSFRNQSDAVRALASERPVILLSGHYGNWEMSVSVFGNFGFPVNVVARPLDNPLLNQWFEQFRENTGNKLIAKRGAYSRMQAVLAKGETIALLGDQDAGQRGTFVDFFDRAASTFPTIARLAVDYDAYICVGYSRRMTDQFDSQGWVQYELGSEEVVDPRDFQGEDRHRQITQQFTLALERAVRLSPEQYFWVHRRWKTKPRQEPATTHALLKAG